MSLNDITPTSTGTMVSSPTFSAASSFDIVSWRSRSSTSSSRMSSDELDDEIVWSVSSASDTFSLSDESSESSLNPTATAASLSDGEEDFVVLRRPRQSDMLTPSRDPARSADVLPDLTRLSLADGPLNPEPPRKTDKRSPGTARPRTRHPSKTQKAYLSPSPSPHPERPDSVATVITARSSGSGRRTRRSRKQAKLTTGLGARPVVDDLSAVDGSSVRDAESPVPSMYDEAVGYISSFLANPSQDTLCTLTFLQSLIIELGLATSSLPASLTSARAFLKSHAFLNIKEYLAVRGQGQSAIQQVLHPSKTALIKDIRRKRSTVPLQWVKANGLQVLLVSPYYH